MRFEESGEPEDMEEPPPFTLADMADVSVGTVGHRGTFSREQSERRLMSDNGTDWDLA